MRRVAYSGGKEIHRDQVAVATKFYTAASNICRPSVWNLLHVTLLAFRILWMAPRFLENLALLTGNVSRRAEHQKSSLLWVFICSEMQYGVHF